MNRNEQFVKSLYVSIVEPNLKLYDKMLNTELRLDIKLEIMIRSFFRSPRILESNCWKISVERLLIRRHFVLRLLKESEIFPVIRIRYLNWILSSPVQ